MGKIRLYLRKENETPRELYDRAAFMLNLERSFAYARA
jgi:hypothetical protein